jgi:hypothetical protein
MSKIDYSGPITRLSGGLAFIDEEARGTFAPLYPPNLSTTQRDLIPVTSDLPGAIIFNVDTEELESYSAAGFWLPILTAESDIIVNQITAEIGDFDVINCNTINNSAKINTTDFESSGLLEATSIAAGNIEISPIGSITTPTMFLSDIAFMDKVVAQSALAGHTGVSDDSPLAITLDVGAGTGATAVLKGSLTSGLIQINTGSAPTPASIIAVFTIPAEVTSCFNGTFGVVLTAASQTTAPILVYADVSPPNLFLIGSSSTLAASTTYYWNYHIIGTRLFF